MSTERRRGDELGFMPQCASAILQYHPYTESFHPARSPLIHSLDARLPPVARLVQHRLSRCDVIVARRG